MPDTLTKTIGERDFTFSPITLGIMRKLNLLEDFKVAAHIRAEVPSTDELESMLRILHGSATVAEPNLTFDEFCDTGFDRIPFLDGVNEIAGILPAVLNLSGFVKSQAGNAVGEATGS